MRTILLVPVVLVVVVVYGISTALAAPSVSVHVIPGEGAIVISGGTPGGPPNTIIERPDGVTLGFFQENNCCQQRVVRGLENAELEIA